ncbi:16S rRNA (cytosine(1402)-N(4))-methyltransferase RsmH [Candidatus Parcubacteria bacterium]|nr:16S rRNA (cytosine(1402)-N(4))-methyltransferase RsmH [Patescibacteria group bacterium]MCG2688441.1 16S rRNA (cytosine(1402)-N(4))-methyltransferase RsmH [Candidatus Parcubacteria bacterium]
MHAPVLLKEVVDWLGPKENENFIDATLGEAGHSLEILKKNGPKGKILGIEQDQEILAATIKTLNASDYGHRIILVNDNFVNLKKIVADRNFSKIKGIVMDLGISSWQLQESGRGFSFLRDEPLIMSLAGKEGLTADKIVNYWSKPELERIFKEFGQEKFAGRIAENIVLRRRVRQIKTTLELVEIIKKAVPMNYERGRISPATRTFMALRITVNNELENLQIALPQAIDVLEKGGKLAVISFHSLEDKIVKHFFKAEEKKERVKVLTKKPIMASTQELQINQRSRSAKLRVVQKTI